MSDMNYLLLKEIKEAVDEGVVSGVYSNFNEPSMCELEQRMRALDEIDVYVVVKTLVKYRRDLFVNILEYMNKKEGEKEK